jgi:hypothetical protein
MTQAQLMVPVWQPDIAFCSMEFDRKRAWGMSALPILDFIVAIGSQSTTDPRDRIKRRFASVISVTTSQVNANLIRARQRCPFQTWSNLDLWRSLANSPLAQG